MPGMSTASLDPKSSALQKLIDDQQWDIILQQIDDNELDVDFKITKSPNGTLLQKAIHQGNLSAMNALEARGASVEACADSGTVVDFAAKWGGVETLEWLRVRGVDMTAKGRDGHTIGHHVAINTTGTKLVNPLSLMNYAVQLGISFNEKNEGDTTALGELLGKADSPYALRLLHMMVRHGADMEIPQKENMGNSSFKNSVPALLKAVKKGKWEWARALYDMGASIPDEEVIGRFCSTKEFPDNGDTNKEKRFQVLKFFEDIATAPMVDVDGPIEKQDLFTLTDDGRTPLDSRETWQNMGVILAKLEERGEQLSLRDLLRENRDGKPWLQRAVECNSLHPVLEHLRKNGEWLDANAFSARGEENGLSPLGRAIFDCAATGDLFHSKHWVGQNPQELQEFYRELPDLLKADVSNIRQLHLDMERAQIRQPGLSAA